MRAAGEADASALAALSSQLGYKATPGDSRHRLADIRARGFAEVFVAERGERQVVGWVHVFVASSLDSDLHGEIGGLVVDDTMRGAGIGALLLRAAEDWCKSQGLREIRVRSNVVRRRAHGFYNREGYADVKTQAVFRKELGTGIVRPIVHEANS